MNRRSLLLGLGSSLIAAPAIVRAASLMPVRALQPASLFTPFARIDELGLAVLESFDFDAFTAEVIKVMAVPEHWLTSKGRALMHEGRLTARLVG